ncbi:hypothetical protein [Streptomyces sp. Caat 7-52]|uniref:hypothetical protein n=1 Tax=Streptomyces sp. Caat 7-52 TaxID=2949637 RepID=UPI002034DDEC|nr:hypothetical protein [Streptomyces sp. Caat 7-52]
MTFRLLAGPPAFVAVTRLGAFRPFGLPSLAPALPVSQALARHVTSRFAGGAVKG